MRPTIWAGDWALPKTVLKDLDGNTWQTDGFAKISIAVVWAT